MSSLPEAPLGLQVVGVEEDGTYSLDMEALRRVLCHKEARGLPVCVISVAGATRGGKTFLLAYFLRYLRASDEARRGTAWIGADDEPLTGFSWRGGWERHTTGIVLWSQPIIVTQEVNGKQRKLAVILMDTQGTFDNSSTVKDCTTIFAMSTLISSVQIYNLWQIIREDDLQHLQLFTEYSKQARNDGGKPFQSLIFRVRDWSFPYQYAYGAEGGNGYLESILKGNTKKQEIKEVRDHIRSSFESVSCILTPSPGKAVTDPNFNGRLCDVEPEFKDALLELVPLILNPQNLVPKVINGNEVLTEELLTYFRTYIDIFNSDELPNPVSIFQAMTQASLETALNKARAGYTGSMEATCGGAKSVPRASVPRLHAASLQVARDAFASHRTLAEPALAAAKLDALMQELDAMLSKYEDINSAKILKALSESRSAYEAVINGVIGSGAVCLHPQDLQDMHDAATAAALAVYDASRLCPDDEDTSDDSDRDEMQQWTDKRGKELTAQNEANNRVAVTKASAVYFERVRRAAAEGVLGEDELAREHAVAKAAAIAAFAAARCRYYDDQGDTYYEELLENIKEQHLEWETSNKKNMKSVRRTALLTYNNYMANVWGPHRCLHPELFRREHHIAVQQAMDDIPASDVQEFSEELESRFDNYKERNEAANAALVNQSYTEYCRTMDVKCAPSASSLLVVPLFFKLGALPKYHNAAMNEALEYFNTNRRSNGDEDDDEYLEELNAKLTAGYDIYCQPLPAVAREFSLPIV